MAEKIEHEGIIKEIQNNKIRVSILSQAACASCHVKGACSMSDVEEKEVEIPLSNEQNVELGDKVKVFYEQKLGFFALFLGYVLPFLLIMTILIVGKQLGYREEIYGLASIGILVPYYSLLYVFKAKLRKRFRFSIEKINEIIN